MSHDSVRSDWLVLWSVHQGRARLNYFDLGENFTNEWHTYELKAEFQDESTDITLVFNKEIGVWGYLQIDTFNVNLARLGRGMLVQCHCFMNKKLKHG